MTAGADTPAHQFDWRRYVAEGIGTAALVFGGLVNGNGRDG